MKEVLAQKQVIKKRQLSSASSNSERSSELDSLFCPDSIAIIGATERQGSVGFAVTSNLLSGTHAGKVFPINPERDRILNTRAYKSILNLETVDLAVIVTPAPTVPAILTDCAKAGVKSVLIISAGFKESGAEGARLEHEILRIARANAMRVVGPNCLGIMRPSLGINATFASRMALPGNVAFLSQSGALCTAVLDWSFQTNVGFSAFISTGSMLDVGWSDLIYYYGDDPATSSILIYMESIGDAGSFLSVAREVASIKPIILLKAGRTEAAAKAAASHTGALTGSDAVMDAAFRRCGVLRVDTIAELFYMADVLAKQQHPRGPRLAVVTNAGGPGVLAADGVVSSGGQLAVLADQTLTQLDSILPPHWSHGNPIDVLGDADPKRFSDALRIAAADPNTDGLLVTLTPQAMTDPTEIARELVASAASHSKPIIASWMGGPEVAEGRKILGQHNIPTFPYPDTAARVFSYMWNHAQAIRRLHEVPMASADQEQNAIDRHGVVEIIKGVAGNIRVLLTETESKDLLNTYHIPTVPTVIAVTEAEALDAAKSIGFPVVLKLYSHTITHKTDVGGVQLNLSTPEMVRAAFRSIRQRVSKTGGALDFAGVTVQPMISATGPELIVGSSYDPQFGPVMLFGCGGQLAEVFKDYALALPPLTIDLARQLISRTRIIQALEKPRHGSPANLDALARILVRFSELIAENPTIREIDINPLVPIGDTFLALDARVVLHPSGSAMRITKPAIRAYPFRYKKMSTLRNGTGVTIRPIKPEDEELMIDFHRTLSESTVYHRYLQVLKLSRRIAHNRLVRMCFIDYAREMALVAEITDDAGTRRIIGIGRLSRAHLGNEAEIAIVISDTYQQQGLGTEFVTMLHHIAADEGIRKIKAHLLCENLPMYRILRHFGYEFRERLGQPVMDAEKIIYSSGETQG